MSTVVWPSTQPNAPQGPPNQQLTQGSGSAHAHNPPVFQAPSGCQPAETEAFHQQVTPAQPALQAAPVAGPSFTSPWPQPRQRLAEKDQSTGGSASSSACSTCSSSTSGGSGDDAGGGGAGVNGSRASSCSGSGGSTPSGSSVVVTVLDAPGSSEAGGAASIYDLYTRRKMYCIMLVVALAALTAPLSNTIFLPAMQAVQQDLHTSAAAVTGSVASFQIAIGLAALVWGPCSDRYGRKPVLVIATLLFALTNVPLTLAPNVAVLLAFRTLQGAAAAAYASAGPGMAADICCPASRGTLFGICSVAALLGPVLGPPLGGGLSQAFGWRSMFVLLAGLSTLVILPLLLLCVPETLQYKVVQRLTKQQPAAALKMAEAPTILGQGAPKFQAPWWPLRIALDRSLFLHVLVMLVGYGTYICSLAVLPFYLSRPPYALSTGGIGAVYIPGAVAAILASPCGGKLADWAARANPQQPLRRVLYANLLGLLTPLSFIMLGWGLQKGLPLAVPLVAGFVASFINSLYMPALFTVLTIVKQDASAAAVGGVYSLIFLLSGSLMMVGAAVVTALGLGPFLTIMAVLHLACTLAAFVHIIRSCSDAQVPQSASVCPDSRQASTAFLQSAMRVVSISLKDPQAAPTPAAAASAAQSGAPAQAGGCRTAGREGGRGAGSGPMQAAAGQATESCGCQAAQLDSCEAGGGGKLAPA